MQINEDKVLDALQMHVGHLGITNKSSIDFQRLMAVLREVERQRDGTISTGSKE